MRNNKNIIINIFWIILGGILLTISMLGKLDATYSGMGGGLLFVGILQLIRAIRIKTDSEYKEKLNIEIEDERNRYINMKAWSWAGYLFVIIAALTTITCMILNYKVYMMIASSTVCLILVLYYASVLILRRKY